MEDEDKKKILIFQKPTLTIISLEDKLNSMVDSDNIKDLDIFAQVTYTTDS